MLVSFVLLLILMDSGKRHGFSAVMLFARKEIT